MSNRRIQLACVYACFVFVVLFLVGWVFLAGFVPPPSPTDSAQKIADQYRDNLTGIRVGMVISIFSAALLLPWGGAVCAQMRRVEGPRSPLVWGWAAAQGCIVIEVVYPCTFWLIAAFRPEDATRVQTFNDLAWLSFIGIVCTGMYQMVALAVVTFRDNRLEPVFPRWFGYLQLWCFLGVVPAGGVFIFKTGPLAFNGVLGFWFPVVTFFTWIVTITIVTARAIKRDDDPPTAGMDLSERVAALEARLARHEPGQRSPLG